MGFTSVIVCRKDVVVFSPISLSSVCLCHVALCLFPLQLSLDLAASPRLCYGASRSPPPWRLLSLHLLSLPLIRPWFRMRRPHARTRAQEETAGGHATSIDLNHGDDCVPTGARARGPDAVLLYAAQDDERGEGRRGRHLHRLLTALHRACPPGPRQEVVAIEVNREYCELGRPVVDKAGVAHRVDFHEGV